MKIAPLEKDGHEKTILSLCNLSVTEALDATIEVIRNKTYIDLDRVIADVFVGNDRLPAGVPRTAIIRIFAYGNQSSVPIYPVKETLIPNILHSKKEESSLFKARLIQFLCNGKSSLTGNFDLNSANEICKWGDHFYGLNDDSVFLLLNELYNERLIDTYRGKAPSKTRDDCYVKNTVRADLLWNLLSQSSILLECYRDDIPIDDTNKFSETPTNSLSSKIPDFDCKHICEWR